MVEAINMYATRLLFGKCPSTSPRRHVLGRVQAPEILGSCDGRSWGSDAASMNLLGNLQGQKAVRGVRGIGDDSEEGVFGGNSVRER
jgi:hypothetical protein